METCSEAPTFVWFWNTWWKEGDLWTHDPRFIPLGVKSRKVDAIMVATGLCDSMSEAQRLVKGGGVSLRKSGPILTPDDEWRKVKDPREVPPAGWPILLRVGNGNWRLVPRKDGKPGWIQLPGIEEFMIPVEHQGIEFWSKLWGE